MDNEQMPPTAGPVGMGGGVPDVGNPAPPTINIAPPQTPVVNVQADPAQLAQVQHDSMFGKMAKAILGQQNQYSTDTNGQLVNNPVPEKPGQLFRSILGAALLGGAAGANGNPAQGIAGGLVRGGAAGVQNQVQQDQQARQQAQQGFENQQKVGEQDRQNTLMHATLAEQHSLQVARQHTSDLQDTEYHDRHNAASGAILSTLDAAGGQPAAIVTPDGVKSDFTAPDLAQAYIKDPSILKAPQGFVRHFIDTTDSSNLTFNGTQWVDDSGKPVNMTDKTTVKAVDVPVDSMTKKVAVTGKAVNAAAGTHLVDDDTTQMLSPTEMGSLNNTRMKNDKEKSDTALNQRRVAAEESNAATNVRKERLEEKQDQEKNNPLSSGPLATIADPKNVGPDGVNHQFLSAVAQTNPQHADLITAIGNGKEIPSAYMLARKEGQALMADVHAAFPDYDVTKAPAYQKLRTSYSSGKDKDQLEAINTAFRHLGQAYKNAESPLAIVPGTQAHATYNSDSDQLKEEVNSAYTHGVLTKEKSESLKGDLQSPIPGTRRAAIKEVFGLLSDKAEEKQRSWQRAKPSQSISDYQFVSPEAQTAYTSVTGKHISPTGELGDRPDNGQNQQFSHVSASGKFGWNGTQWVPIAGK